MNHSATYPIVITESEFSDQVLNADKPVLVDFWAEWCGPCRALGPVIESIAADYSGKATIAKLDVDANQGIAAQFGIRSIPTVMLFDKGAVVDTFVGVRPKSDYTALLDKTIG